jgi:hypothetical protein
MPKKTIDSESRQQLLTVVNALAANLGLAEEELKRGAIPEPVFQERFKRVLLAAVAQAYEVGFAHAKRRTPRRTLGGPEAKRLHRGFSSALPPVARPRR